MTDHKHDLPISVMKFGGLTITVERKGEPSEAERGLIRHIEALLDAATIVAGRSGQRGEVWRRSGIKGACFQLMAKAERAFSEAMSGQTPDPDNFIDAINYAAFALRLLDSEDVEGVWPWEGS